jgi:hypothetical protein
MPRTSISTPAVTSATTGCMCCGIPAGVCSAIAVQTVSISCCAIPCPHRKSRAACAPSTSKRAPVEDTAGMVKQQRRIGVSHEFRDLPRKPAVWSSDSFDCHRRSAAGCRTRGFACRTDRISLSIGGDGVAATIDELVTWGHKTSPVSGRSAELPNVGWKVGGPTRQARDWPQAVRAQNAAPRSRDRRGRLSRRPSIARRGRLLCRQTCLSRPPVRWCARD